MSDPEGPRVIPLRPRRCPMCGAPADSGYRPFCSKRCADLDLARWFNESYAIPAAEEDDPDDGDPGT